MSVLNYSRTDYIDPILGGVEILNRSFDTSKKGTLGMIVKKGSQYFGLTALHVLIDYHGEGSDLHNLDNYSGFNSELIDDRNGIIIQPAVQGYKSGLVLKQPEYFDPDNDAGIYILMGRTFNPNQHINAMEGKIERILTSTELIQGTKVKKMGIGTNETHGIIESVNENGKMTIVADPKDGHDVSAGGDSGAIWCLNNNEKWLTAIGLHSEGKGPAAIAYSLSKIFLKLKIELL